MSSHSRHLAITLVTAVSSIVLLSLIALITFSASRPDLTWLDYDHDTQSLAESTRTPQILFYESQGPPTDVHTFHDDGELIVGIHAPRHPIFHILEHANKHWDAALNAHGGDQARAMSRYRHRTTGRYRDLSSTNDPIYAPLHLFTPISPSLLGSRQREAEILSDTFTLTLDSGLPSITYGNLSQAVTEEHRAKRIEHLLNAIRPFVQFLPNLRATFSLLEHPRHVLPFQASEVLTALAADRPLPNSPVKFRSQSEPAGTGAPHGRPIHQDDLALLEKIMTRREPWNWEGGCRAKLEVVDSSEDGDEDQMMDSTPPIRFVDSPEARSDSCVHRTLTELHPFFDTEPAYHTRLSPVVSDTAAPWASDILLPPLDFFDAQLDEDAPPVIPWERKTSGLFWSGRKTSDHPSHPTTRLHELFSATADSSTHEFILPAEGEGFMIEHKRLEDVFTYEVKSGDEEVARWEEAGWKFLVDVGEGVRMRERMASGALVFRPVLLGDWITEHSVPWVHYVPVQPDLSDLPSLVAFFERHDTLARRIADAGQAWAEEQLSRERARESVKAVLEGFANLGL